MKHLCKFLCIMLCVTLVVPAAALAHKVIVFAFVEDNRIFVEAGFGSHNPVHQGLIHMVDESGRVWFEGRTDDQGKLSIPVPQAIAGDLEVILEAGPAHKAQWRIPISELKSEETVVNNDPPADTPVPDPEDKRVEKIRNALQEGPSLLKIGMGIGIICMVFFLIGRFKSRKIPHA